MALGAAKSVVIKFVGDKKGLDKTVDGVGTSADKLSKKLGKVGKGMTLGVTAPIVAGAAAAVVALGRIEKIGAQTDAAIESTGGAANVTRKEIDDLAGSLEGLTSVEAESITEGQNMLLTFTNIKNEVGEGNDIFNQTTGIMTDMSVALGQDMKSSAIQLGKALNDPIKGITALSRVGVSFTDQQKEQIAALVEAGDTMGAQKVILAELNKEFGGSAEALGETMQGKLAIVGHSFGTMAETLATALLPAIQSLTVWLQKAADWFNNMSPAGQKTVGILIAIAAAVGPVLIIMSKLVTAFGVVGKAFKALSLLMAANPYVLIIAATIAIVTLIVLNWDKISAFLGRVWEGIKRVAGQVWDAIKSAIKTAVDFIVNLFLNWTLPGLLIKHWDTIKAGVLAVKDFIVDTWEKVLDFFRALPGRVAAAIGDLFGGIRDAFRAAINWVIDKWNNFGFKAGFNIPSIFGGGRVEIGFDTPNIPRLHAGGVFQPPPGQSEGLALLRRGETVSANGQGSVVLNFYAPVYGLEDFERKLQEVIVRARRKGMKI